MLVGRIIETEATYLDSAGEDRGASHPFDATFSGPLPALIGYDAGSWLGDAWDGVVDVTTSAVDRVVDVSTSVRDKTVAAADAITATLQAVAGPILDTAQTWFDRVRSWGGNAGDWVQGLAKVIGEGVAAYGGNLDAWLHALPVVAQIYDGIRATVRLTTEVLTLVPRLSLAITRGENLADFIGKEVQDFGRNAGAAAEFAAALSSFIPGLGQVVGPALALAAGLLEGKDISDAIVAATCNVLPGGALVQAGAQFGARVGYKLATGQRIDRAALSALKESLPEDSRAAFVAAVELAQGESIETAISKAAAEGLNTSALLKSAGLDVSQLTDFGDIVKYNSFPQTIRDGIGTLRSLGGTVSSAVNVTVPRFPGMDEARALAAKANISETEAHVALAAFGGAKVLVFNVAVCPLPLKAKLKLLKGQGGSAMGLVRIEQILRATALGEHAPATITKTAAAVWRASSLPDDQFELAVARAWNLAASDEAQRTMPGGAVRHEVGQTIIVHGKTQGVPPVILRIRNQRLVAARPVSLASAVAKGAITLPSSPFEAAAPRYRPFFNALSAPTPIVPVASTKSTLAALTSSNIVSRPRIALTLPTVKGSKP